MTDILEEAPWYEKLTGEIRTPEQREKDRQAISDMMQRWEGDPEQFLDRVIPVLGRQSGFPANRAVDVLG